ncbi:MAG: hypothetical protein AAFQ14_08210, partial [Cyanobacteria bacterium J06621_12]
KILIPPSLEPFFSSKYGGIKILEYIFKNNISAKVIMITAHSGMTYQDSSGNKKGVFDRAKELGAYECLSRNKGKNYLNELNKIISY